VAVVARNRTIRGYAIPGIVLFFAWLVLIILAIILEESAVCHHFLLAGSSRARFYGERAWKLDLYAARHRAPTR